MSHSPYAAARELYASNMHVAEQNALEVERRLLDDYAAAKRQYQAAHQHYTSRGRVTPAAPAVAAPAAPHSSREPYTIGSVLDYTAMSHESGGCSPPKTAPETQTAARTHRVEGNCENSATRKTTCTIAVNTSPLVGPSTSPRELVVSYPTFAGYPTPSDPLFRGAVADVQATCALFSVAEVRHAIEEAQRDVIERAMFPGLRRTLAVCEPSRELAVKDAQPLWQRVQVIRQETESEEEITYRNLQLGYVVQRDLIEKGILALNPVNKLLMAGPVSPATGLYDDAIQFAFRAERLALASAEETARMRLIDQAWEVRTEVLAVFFEMACAIAESV